MDEIGGHRDIYQKTGNSGEGIEDAGMIFVARGNIDVQRFSLYLEIEQNIPEGRQNNGRDKTVSLIKDLSEGFTVSKS